MASPIVWADVVDIDATLAAVPIGGQTAIIAYVYRRLSVDRWADRLDDGALMYAAHLGALTLRGGVSGPVIAQRLGDASEAYGMVARLGARSNFDATAWGLEFQNLVRGLGILSIVA